MHRGWTALAVAVTLLAAACGASGDSGDDASKTPTIALLLPESKTTRYEAFDKPIFEARLKRLCPGCSFLYNNADQDPAKQQQQVEAALTRGADVLVLDAVDAAAVAPLVNQAKRKKVPVIAYDRLISSVTTTTCRSTTYGSAKYRAGRCSTRSLPRAPRTRAASS